MSTTTIDVKIEPSLGECKNYTPKGGAEQTVSIVISPLRVIIKGEPGNKEDKGAFVTSGCNMFRSCYNHNCWFSVAARDAKPESVTSHSDGGRYAGGGRYA